MTWDMAAAPNNSTTPVVLFDITGAGVFIGAGSMHAAAQNTQIQLTIDGVPSGFLVAADQAASSAGLAMMLLAPFKTSGKLEMKLQGIAAEGQYWATVVTR